jgi:gag-polypeptide of LTR copia-type/Zinc knuckle
MASTSMNQNNGFSEGNSTVRPPLFNGLCFSYWKNRMQIFLEGIDMEMWEVIEDGPTIPMKKIEDGTMVPKTRKEFDANDKKLHQLNKKTMNHLFCALGPNEYNLVSMCKSAKEIWDKLEITFEGTTKVKDSKLRLITLEYELFKANPGEEIKDVSRRFNTIINNLQALGKVYTNKDIVNKMLNSLPKEWEAKVTAIEEANDMETLSLDELMGSLLTHEMKMNQNKEVAEPSKKNGIAFKSTTKDDSEVDDEEALFAKRFEKYARLKKERRFQRRESHKDESSKRDKDPIICYECNKPGHIKFDCPMMKKRDKFHKKQAMVATWSDSDSSDDDNDEVANLCLMALDEPKVSPNLDFCEVSDYSFDELQDAFDDLTLEYKAMKSKYKNTISSLKEENDLLSSKLSKEDDFSNSKLKEEIEALTKVNIDYKTKVNELQVQIDDLNKKNENLQKSFSKFYMGTKKLNEILDAQRASFDRDGLGYNRFEVDTKVSNFFEKPSHIYDVTLKCINCHKIGHDVQICPLKKLTYRRKIMKSVWIPKGIDITSNDPNLYKFIPKGTRIIDTNPKGHKMNCVPKNKE